MRVSRHNGRSGSRGAYNPKHNDREFDLEKAEEIEKEITRNNLYWNCITEQIVRHDELASNALCFTDVEKRYYDLVYMGYVNGQNERNISRIIEESKPSILEILHTRNEAIKEQKNRAIDASERKRRNDPCL